MYGKTILNHDEWSWSFILYLKFRRVSIGNTYENTIDTLFPYKFVVRYISKMEKKKKKIALSNIAISFDFFLKQIENNLFQKKNNLKFYFGWAGL